MRLEPSVVVRPLEEKDLDTLAELESLIQAEPWSRGSFQEEITVRPPRFFVLEAAGRLAAYGGFRQTLEESYIINLGVRPHDRRKGFGKLMLSFLMARAREAGSSVLRLEVRADNEAAIQFYESLGFRNLGRRPGMYAGGADGFAMSKELL